MLQSSSSAPNNFMVVNKYFGHLEALFDFVNIWFELMFKPDLTEEEFKTYAVAEDVLPQNYAFGVVEWPYINPRIANIQAVNAGKLALKDLAGESRVRAACGELDKTCSSYSGKDIISLSAV